MFYAILADIVVFIHLLYILCVVGGTVAVIAGGAAGKSWIRIVWLRVVHLCMIGVVALQALAGKMCPLTIIEYDLREAAGQTVEREISFLGRLIRRVIFFTVPEGVLVYVYIGFMVIVAATFVLFPPGNRRRTK